MAKNIPKRKNIIPMVSRKVIPTLRQLKIENKRQRQEIHDLEIEVADLLEENWRLRLRLALYAQFGIKRLPSALELASWPIEEQIRFLVCYHLTTKRPWVDVFDLTKL